MIDGNKGNLAVKTITGLFLKTNKKRLIIAIIISIIIFTLLSSFLLTWFNYRYRFFYNAEASYDWYRDNQTSVTYTTGLEEKINESSFNFDLAVDEIYSTANAIASGLFDNYTASMYSFLDSVKYSPLTQSYSASLFTLQQEAYEFLADNLIEGRMPNNKTELIYRSFNTSNPIYNLGEQVGLQVESFVQNFTIVGILGDFLHSFYQEGYSNDLFHHITSFRDGYYQFVRDFFLTTHQNFVEIMSFYPAGSIQMLSLDIDFDYQLTIENIRNLKEITNKINVIQWSILDYDYLPSKNHNFCSDLESFIVNFQISWNYQTVKTFSMGVPAIFLLSLICIEIFNIGNFEKSAQFRLFKLYGLEFRIIWRILFVENIIIASLGLIFGVLLGTLFGYFFTLGLGNMIFESYLNAFLEPVVFVAIIVFFTAIFVGGFVIELRFAKRTVQLTSEIFKSKRKKPIRKFFTSIETLLILLGAIILVIGFTGMFLLQAFYLENVYASNKFEIISLELIFMFLTVIGGSLIFISIFLILSRLVVILWRFIGEQIWKRRKNYFTLALKQLSIYSKDYQRIILAMFMICLCVIPGLILVKSVDDHLVTEANLAVGFSDLMIDTGGNNNFQIIENISSIDEVELCTGVEVITLTERSNIRATNSNDRVFSVDILNIYNVSEFVTVISTNFPNKMEYSLEDISQLETSMTYMMSSKFAHKEKYDRGRVYKSSKIAYPDEEPLNLTYVNKFACFPLLPIKPYNYFISLRTERYNLVMSNLTSSQLLDRVNFPTSIQSDYYILVKISPTANKTAISETIENLPFSLSVKTCEEQLNSLQLGEVNKFKEALLVIITIIASFAILLFGFLTARNIYTQRLRIIESEYQVGAKNYQIWGNFSIELFLVILIPLLVSVLITSILLYEIYRFLLDIPQISKEFVPWLPVWLVGLILLFCLIVVFCGWLPKMITRVNKYKPARQE